MRRAQAALEFLTTYGWAFLVILVMIGALAYFGILSPDRFLPERCNVGPEFNCDEYIVGDSTNLVSPSILTVRFTNNVGQTISGVTVDEVGWAQEEFSITAGTLNMVAAPPAGPGDCSIEYQGGGTSARGGDWIEVRCQFTNAGALAFPPAGQKMKFNLDMTYLPQGKQYVKPLTAEVYTSLQS